MERIVEVSSKYLNNVNQGASKKIEKEDEAKLSNLKFKEPFVR